MEIGERLFSLRQKTGESLQQVADAVGVSKAHIWELEKGRSKNPSFELVRKLATHYGVSIDVLTGEDMEPGQRDMQIERIHRSLEDLSERDRGIVEQMVASMAAKKAGDA
ncbi:helix-turn-helix domain-containing protein [Aliiruegeria lutimaris]|uniref:Transcriptional regulator, contains XRE-family HTH domain n=1 Tax=Aliiruegeria lutimaris TaxID=571298 RepID=A0A1G9DNG0_9RHOB|nr:helix-turn-helix transcriptional regulator [Aliiruegeria lutimaris]SDK65325.1 Transcriptional regulator, contains XRE-family HTH domain [Aliiruegeria lutimaris]